MLLEMFIVASNVNNHGSDWVNTLILLLIATIGGILRYLPYWKPKGPLVDCMATVKSKRVEYSNTPSIYYRGERFNYVVTFVDEEGKEVDLFTIPEIYSSVKEGDFGRLKYQRETILEFTYE